MIGLIRSDLRRYASTNSNLAAASIIAAYTHPAIVGVIWYRIGHALWLKRKNPLFYVLLVINRILYPLVRIYSGLELSPRTQIGPGLFVAHFGPTVIHPSTVAGRNLTLEQGVTIGRSGAGVPHIGHDVFIGTGARVIGGITIGDHVSVGAGAVVVKDVPPNCVVVGIPARPVRVHGESQTINEKEDLYEIKTTISDIHK
jgi:serine O-acetyltransferase